MGTGTRRQPNFLARKHMVLHIDTEINNMHIWPDKIRLRRKVNQTEQNVQGKSQKKVCFFFLAEKSMICLKTLPRNPFFEHNSLFDVRSQRLGSSCQASAAMMLPIPPREVSAILSTLR